MESIQQFGSRLNWRYVILGVVVWWLAMLIVYSILSLRVNTLKNRQRNAGVELTHEFANLVSLPLLERDSPSIHKLLTDAANRADVIYVSVVDHRNKVVAFTGTGHLMPDMTATAQSVENVSIREGGFASHANIVNFVSDITYAGTKIGEIFIGLSAPDAVQARKKIMTVAVASSLLLLFLIALFRYPSIRPNLAKVYNFSRSRAGMDTGAQGATIACPLCGIHNPVSATIFKPSNLDKLLTSGSTIQKDNIEPVADSSAKEPASRSASDDLSWLRRRIIVRCSEIIRKLAA